MRLICGTKWDINVLGSLRGSINVSNMSPPRSQAHLLVLTWSLQDTRICKSGKQFSMSRTLVTDIGEISSLYKDMKNSEDC